MREGFKSICDEGHITILENGRFLTFDNEGNYIECFTACDENKNLLYAFGDCPICDSW